MVNIKKIASENDYRYLSDWPLADLMGTKNKWGHILTGCCIKRDAVRRGSEMVMVCLMPRRSRIDAAGALHQVMVRGMERGAVFRLKQRVCAGMRQKGFHSRSAAAQSNQNLLHATNR